MNTKYYLDKSQTSINDLIQDNLDLVKKIAWQLHGRVQNIVEVEDLIQQGMEGLVHAAQKYSPKEGVNFSQYAQLRIRGSIIDFLRKNSNLCRTTIKKKQEFDKYRFDLEKKLNRNASERELIEFIGNAVLIFTLLNLSSGAAAIIFPFIIKAAEEMCVYGYIDNIFIK